MVSGGKTFCFLEVTIFLKGRVECHFFQVTGLSCILFLQIRINNTYLFLRCKPTTISMQVKAVASQMSGDLFY